MYGIVGGLGPSFKDPNLRQKFLKKMSENFGHSELNSADFWTDRSVALAQTSSGTGALYSGNGKPHQSLSGRFIACFWGNLFNYFAILKNVRTSSPDFNFDKLSVSGLLAISVEIFGWEETLKQAQGAFVLAVWDRDTQTLFLGRDQIGKKNLYWGRIGSDWVFSSELKFLLLHPKWSGDLDPLARLSYFKDGYIPVPLSIYKGIRKLPAGTWVALKESYSEFPPPQAYWSLKPLKIGSFKENYEEACSRFEVLFDDSLKYFSASLGTKALFLSGGLGSALAALFWAKTTTSPIKTFSLNFTGTKDFESMNAQSISQILGADHQEFKIDDQSVWDYAQEFINIFDEPFSDLTGLSIYILGQKIRFPIENVIVGLGANESFAGYSRYSDFVKAASFFSKSPEWLLSLIGTINQRTSMVRKLPLQSREEVLYHCIKYQNPTCVNFKTLDGETSLWNRTGFDLVEKAMWDDSLQNLSSKNYFSADRAAESTGLKLFAPFTDFNMVEFAWSLPLDFKWNIKGGKRILKTVLSCISNNNLINPSKEGYKMPIEGLLKGPLKPLIEEFLTHNNLETLGITDGQYIKKLWKSFQLGQKEWGVYFWKLMIYQNWLHKRNRK